MPIHTYEFHVPESVCVRAWVFEEVGLKHKQFGNKNTVVFSLDHIWHFKCLTFHFFRLFFSSYSAWNCPWIRNFLFPQCWCLQLNFVETVWQTEAISLTLLLVFFSTFEIDYLEFWDIVFLHFVIVVTHNFSSIQLLFQYLVRAILVHLTSSIILHTKCYTLNRVCHIKVVMCIIFRR